MARVVGRSILLAELGGSVVEAATTSTESTTTTTGSVSSDSSAYSWIQLVASNDVSMTCVPFDDTPAPISMSGSSMTIPPSNGRPPVPPCSAFNAHSRSALVRREIGITLMPV